MLISDGSVMQLYVTTKAYAYLLMSKCQPFILTVMRGIGVSGRTKA